LKRRTTTKADVTRGPSGVQRRDADRMHRTLAGRAGTEPVAAELRLQQFRRAASKFAHRSLREMAAAAQACREPMKSIWQSVARASRNILKDATAAWHEMTPPPPLGRQSVAGKARRSIA
jgi:DNA-binding PucR family transcriptional regulator